MVHIIHEDPDHSGFFVLCSKEYDELLELEHSHRDEIFINFERQIEPGIINIFCMDIKSEPVADEGDNVQKITMSMLGMRDDEFTFDRNTYIEKKVKNDDPKSLHEWKYIQDLDRLTYEPHIYAQISAFTVSWPYIAWSGMEDFLTVLNLNAPNYVHRVELTEPDQPRMRIKQTQISATNDLFAMTLQDTTYRVFMIDLEADDLNKLE